jgi:SNF2 family DNA or RNA helicase
MKYEPYGYQSYATDRIVSDNALGCFYPMGAGKSVIALTAIERLMYELIEVQRVLVIAPLRVAEHTWVREASKWDHLSHLRISRVLGTAAERRRALAAESDVYVINRENVQWLVEECGSRWPFDMVVIDELSSFKSSKAQRFKALRKVRPQVARIVGLTGTPAPNGLLDLWSQVYLLDQGERLGRTVTAYRNRYFEPDKRNFQQVWSWKLVPGAEAAIHAKISGLCISMKAEDWLELPERVDRDVTVELNDDAREVYLKMEREWLLDLGNDIIDAGSAVAVCMKLLQLANGAVYDGQGQVVQVHDDKLDVLEDLIEAANGNPVLVYYSFQHDLTRIRERIPGTRTLLKERDIDDWNAGKVPIMLAHPASAGHGLNLQDGGSVIIWFGPTWSLELYQQANARLYRQGQTRTVIVHHLIAEDTIDEQVMKVLTDKAARQDRLIEAVKARIGRHQS